MANLLNLVKFSHRVQAHNYVSTSANEKAGQSRRKSLKSGSYGFFPHHQGAQHVLQYIVKTVHGFCQIVYDNLGYLYPGYLCGPD